VEQAGSINPELAAAVLSKNSRLFINLPFVVAQFE
jgi:hypothetical protein